MSSDRTLATCVVEGDAPHLELEAVELKVVKGPDRGLVVRLGTESVLVGSAPSCEIVLHDPTVSARHAEVQVTARGYFIRDLTSTNGTRVGKLPIVLVPLADGMRLSLGETDIVVRSLGQHDRVPLASAGRCGALIAHSVKMRALVATLEQVAVTDSTVLIEGETGTGKEVVAEALHASSKRARGPFVVVDCAALQSSLLLAELFGYERGAFTGADQSRPGLFEEAEGGTLFFDEIGELPLAVQPMLLGGIERRVSRRVGGRADIGHDVRIVAATNRNLREEVTAQRFREDLYYRLAVVRLRVPPLRERGEDLPHLIEALSADATVRVTPELRALCLAYQWPGNVRELRNTLQRLAADPEAANLVPAARPRPPEAMPLQPLMFDDTGNLRPLPEARRLVGDEFERRYLAQALARANGRVLRAGELGGVSRRFMTRLVAKHGLRKTRDE